MQYDLHTATATLERLHTSDRTDATIMHQQAHRLKSSARSVGTQRLGELCQALEDAGRADDVQRLSPLLTELTIEWQAVEQFIHRYMDSIA